ncbi:MAG: hypothetical protein QM817_32470 [Archangium sp.]
MNFLLLAMLLQAEPDKPHHVLQCDDARRVFDALVAAGVPTDSNSTLKMEELSCSLGSGPPGVKMTYGCHAPMVTGAKAERLWDALSKTGIQAVGGMMNFAFIFSDVRCEQTPRGVECRLTNEMQAGSGDLRGDKVVKLRKTCAR